MTNLRGTFHHRRLTVELCIRLQLLALGHYSQALAGGDFLAGKASCHW
jgi:hypothetical protein